MADEVSRNEKWSHLMTNAQKGDSAAYHDLLSEVAGVAEAFCNRRLSDKAYVNDIVQDILLSVHVSRHTYDPKRAFSPWVFSIIRRRYIDHIRKITGRTKREFLDNELDWVRIKGDNEDGLSNIFDLRNAINKLPDKQKEVFQLMKIQGLSVKEVAEKNGMSESAVKVSSHRAQKTLKRFINGR